MFKTIPIIVMAALCLNFNSLAQSQKTLPLPNKQAILGKVVSATTGEALPGAVIKIMTPNHTTISNDKGEFILTLSNGTYNISISHLSYKTKNISIQIPLKKQLIITLDTDDKNLQEVEINAGYYTVKEKERTGSISRVTAETIGKQPVSNPMAALIGRMPGVNIEQQNGIYGGNYKIEIRGVNSLRTDAREPLYLVDGVPFPATPISNSQSSIGISMSPLDIISPSDIESIEILKDADATSIYGSRGANGVVLIKTKTGKIGKTAIDVNVYSGISKVTSKLDLLTTPQYLEMRNEAFKNDGVTPGPTAYDVNGVWDKDRYTDWQEVLIGGTAHQTNIQASLIGGNESTQFVFRGNYSKQTTVFPDDFADARGSATLNVNHSSTNNKFKANFTVTYAKNNKGLPAGNLAQYITMAPNAPPLFDAEGDLNWALNSTGAATWVNPLQYIYQPYYGDTNNLISNALLNYELIPGLFLRSSFGYTNMKANSRKLRPIKAQAPAATVTGAHGYSRNGNETWIAEPQINFRKQFGLGSLNILIGTTFQKNEQITEALSGSGYTNDLLLEDFNSAPTKFANTSSALYKYSALFGRVNYNYDDKYIVNLTGRRDGSSRFGPGKQFGNFGAVGLGWLFSNEKLVKNNFPVLSYGKLRGSYGVTGSDQIGDYGFLETYTATQAYQDGIGLFPTRLANPDYSWETNRKLELALELGFINDKILFTGSWYRNRSSNQLVGYPLPDITGFSIIQYNLPATVQNIGWEFELNTLNLTKKSLSWKTSFNITVPKNKLLSYPNIEGSSYETTYTVGESLFTPRVYHYLGVDPQTGLYQYADLNRSNTVDAADRRAAGKSLTSHLYGGLSNTLSYKNFTLDVFFQFVDKTAQYPFASFAAPGTIGNKPSLVMNRWQQPGDITAIEKFSQSTAAGGAYQKFGYLFSSDNFQDASFIKLKNLSISWNAPSSWIQKVKLNSLRLYLQGQNLFTITKYPGDPEVGNTIALPPLTTFVVGIQLNF